MGKNRISAAGEHCREHPTPPADRVVAYGEYASMNADQGSDLDLGRDLFIGEADVAQLRPRNHAVLPSR